MRPDTIDVWPDCPAPFNLAAHVLRHAALQPDNDALICPDNNSADPVTWRYGALANAVQSIAAGLLARGARPGDRVLLRLGNTDAFPIAYLAAIAAGLVAVPTSSQLTEAEISHMAALVAPKLVIQDPAIAAPEGTKSAFISPSELMDMRALPAAPFHMGDPHRPGYIVFTSGTSGAPRAVVHAHRAIWARGMMTDGWYALREADRVLHAGAFNWTFTLGTGLMDPWAQGATAIIPAPGTDAGALADLLSTHQATIFAAAPGIYRRLLKSALPALPALRHGLSAGEKLPEAIRQSWQDQTGTQIYEAFGMSECSTFISASPAAPAPRGSLGRPQPGRRVALLNEAGDESDEGVIAVHRSDPGLMLGYLDAPEATAARYQGDWFVTGDHGQRLPSGDIVYQGRDDDLMTAGGFRVAPAEVEAALQDAPGLTAVAVTEVEIKPTTRVIAAFYTAETKLDPDALDALATRRLARYKRPRLYLHRDALPTSANGKLLRRVLRETYEAPDGET